MSATGQRWNPYFVAYCAATRTTPEEAARRPFRGAPFILWIDDRWREWDELRHGGKRPSWRTDAEREEFGEWLMGRAEELAA